MCPFELHKSTWSTWPVLVSYLNLPPWLETKKNLYDAFSHYFCKNEIPSEYIEVWLRPLIDKLQILWRGVPAFDILEAPGQRKFILQAVVLYTTQDYLGYRYRSGAAHQGVVACPPCGSQLQGRYSKDLHKFEYARSRRWLCNDHFLRTPEMDQAYRAWL